MPADTTVPAASTVLTELLVADDPGAWRACGFAVDADGVCRVGAATLRIDPAIDGRGVVAWTVAGAPDPTVAGVEGLATSHGEVTPSASGPAPHPIGALRIDHVVVFTPDVARTADAVTASLGLPVRRWRDGEAGGQPVRQAFFRMGEVVLELVGPPDPGPDATCTPARFFGLAITVADLPAAAALLGPDRLGTIRAAVQPGRHIATIRSNAGLHTAVALMDR